MAAEDGDLMTRLQGYVPFLSEMIINLKADMPQHGKIVALLAIITEKRKKFKYETLRKCEEVIIKMQTKTNYKRKAPSPIKFPSPPLNEPEEGIVPTIRSPDPDNWSQEPESVVTDRYTHERPSVYSCAAESIQLNKPSVFDRLGAKFPAVETSRPIINMADLDCDYLVIDESPAAPVVAESPPIRPSSKVSLVPAPIIKPKPKPTNTEKKAAPEPRKSLPEPRKSLSEPTKSLSEPRKSLSESRKSLSEPLKKSDVGHVDSIFGNLLSSLDDKIMVGGSRRSQDLKRPVVEAKKATEEPPKVYKRIADKYNPKPRKRSESVDKEVPATPDSPTDDSIDIIFGPRWEPPPPPSPPFKPPQNQAFKPTPPPAPFQPPFQMAPVLQMRPVLQPFHPQPYNYQHPNMRSPPSFQQAPFNNFRPNYKQFSPFEPIQNEYDLGSQPPVDFYQAPVMENDRRYNTNGYVPYHTNQYDVGYSNGSRPDRTPRSYRSWREERNNSRDPRVQRKTEEVAPPARAPRPIGPNLPREEHFDRIDYIRKRIQKHSDEPERIASRGDLKGFKIPKKVVVDGGNKKTELTGDKKSREDNEGGSHDDSSSDCSNVSSNSRRAGASDESSSGKKDESSSGKKDEPSSGKKDESRVAATDDTLGSKIVGDEGGIKVESSDEPAIEVSAPVTRRSRSAVKKVVAVLQDESPPGDKLDVKKCVGRGRRKSVAVSDGVLLDEAGDKVDISKGRTRRKTITLDEPDTLSSEAKSPVQPSKRITRNSSGSNRKQDDSSGNKLLQDESSSGVKPEPVLCDKKVLRSARTTVKLPVVDVKSAGNNVVSASGSPEVGTMLSPKRRGRPPRKGKLSLGVETDPKLASGATDESQTGKQLDATKVDGAKLSESVSDEKQTEAEDRDIRKSGVGSGAQKNSKSEVGYSVTGQRDDLEVNTSEPRGLDESITKSVVGSSSKEIEMANENIPKPLEATAYAKLSIATNNNQSEDNEDEEAILNKYDDSSADSKLPSCDSIAEKLLLDDLVDYKKLSLVDTKLLDDLSENKLCDDLTIFDNLLDNKQLLSDDLLDEKEKLMLSSGLMDGKKIGLSAEIDEKKSFGVKGVGKVVRKRRKSMAVGKRKSVRNVENANVELSNVDGDKSEMSFDEVEKNIGGTVKKLKNSCLGEIDGNSKKAVEIVGVADKSTVVGNDGPNKAVEMSPIVDDNEMSTGAHKIIGVDETGKRTDKRMTSVDGIESQVGKRKSTRKRAVSTEIDRLAKNSNKIIMPGTDEIVRGSDSQGGKGKSTNKTIVMSTVGQVMSTVDDGDKTVVVNEFDFGSENVGLGSDENFSQVNPKVENSGELENVSVLESTKTEAINKIKPLVGHAEDESSSNEFSVVNNRKAVGKRKRKSRARPKSRVAHVESPAERADDESSCNESTVVKTRRGVGRPKSRTCPASGVGRVVDESPVVRADASFHGDSSAVSNPIGPENSKRKVTKSSDADTAASSKIPKKPSTEMFDDSENLLLANATPEIAALWAHLQSESLDSTIRQGMVDILMNHLKKKSNDAGPSSVKAETNCETSEEEFALKVPKQLRKRKNELDKLHEDIKQTIGEGALSAVGTKRACTVGTKEEESSSVESESSPKRKKVEPISDSPRQKAKNLRVVIEKLPDLELHRSQTTVVGQSDDDMEEVALSDRLDEMAPTESAINKARRGRKPHGGILKKKKRPLENDDETIEPDTPTGGEGVTPFDLTSEKEYYLQPDASNSCKFCGYRGKGIIAHYMGEHPHNDVYISKLSPDETKLALEEAQFKNYEADELMPEITGRSKKDSFNCRFCKRIFDKVTRTEFYDHVTTHTGEVRFKCRQCYYKSYKISNARYHIRTVHKTTQNEEIIILPIPPSSSDRIIFGYICSECNFLQMNKLNVENHIDLQHGGADATIFRINMSHEMDMENLNGRVVDVPLNNFTTNSPVVDPVDDEDDGPIQDPVHDPVDDTPVEADMNAFLVDLDESIPSETNLEEKRLEKMKEIQESIQQMKRTSFVNQLKTRLDDEEAVAAKQIQTAPEKPCKLEEEIEVNMITNELDVKASVVTLLDELTVVETMRDTQPIVMPTLTKTTAATFVSDRVITVGIISAIITNTTHLYNCNHRSCVFRTAERMIFQAHCNLTHKDQCSELRCSECNALVEEPQPMEALFEHLCEHLDELQPPKISCRITNVTSLSKKTKGLLQTSPKNVPTKTPPLSSPENVPHASTASTQKLTCKLIPMSSSERTQPKKDALVLQQWMHSGALMHLFKCPFFSCDFTTNAEVQFEFHINKSHNFGDGLLPCSYCNFKMHMKFLKAHIMMRHADSCYGCSYCLYRAICSDYIQVHQESKHPGQPIKMLTFKPQSARYKAPELPLIKNLIQPYLSLCGMKFYAISNFDQHMTSCLFCNKSYLCYHCDMQCLNFRLLITHYRRHGVFEFHCRYCPKGAHGVKPIFNHIALDHPYLKTRVIWRQLKNSGELGKDEDTNIFDSLIVINVDESTVMEDPVPDVSEEPDQQAHVLPVTQPPVEEPETQPALKTVARQQTPPPSSPLTSIVDLCADSPEPLDMEVTDEKDESATKASGLVFKCSNCQLEVNTSLEFRSHLNMCIVTGVTPKPFICSQCSKAFKHAQNLVDHVRSHGTQNYSCQLCDYKHTHPWHVRCPHSRRNAVRGAFRVEEELSSSHAHSVVGNGWDGRASPGDGLGGQQDVKSVTLLNEGAETKRSKMPWLMRDLSEVTLKLEETPWYSTYAAVKSDFEEDSKISIREAKVFKRNAVDSDSDEDSQEARKHADRFRRAVFRRQAVDSDSGDDKNSIRETRNSRKHAEMLRRADVRRNLIGLRSALPDSYTTTSLNSVIDSATSYIAILNQIRSHTLTVHHELLVRNTQLKLKGHMRSVHKIQNVSITSVDPTKSVDESTEFICRAKQRRSTVSEVSRDSDTLSVVTEPDEPKTRYSPEEIILLPFKAIYSHDVICSICNFSTKVRMNLVRHMQLHKNNVAVEIPTSAPVNPVPCLEKNELMFDKMANLALSSHVGGRMGAKPAASKEAPPTNLKLPPYIPANKRYVCGAKNCNYLCLEEDMLRRHLEALHAHEQAYTCVHCNDNLTTGNISVDDILLHLRLHGGSLYKCGYCDLIGQARSLVERHCGEKHGEKSCKVIVLRENNSSVVVEQPEDGTKERKRPWHCGMCKAKYSKQLEVASHAKSKHGLGCRYKCSYCFYKSEERDGFKQHFATAHKDLQEDVIVAYFFAETESSKPVEPEPEAFDTTPLWVKNKKTYVKTIRGILLDEPTAAVKKSPVKVTPTPSPEKKPTKVTVIFKKKTTTPVADKTAEGVESTTRLRPKTPAFELPAELPKLPTPRPRTPALKTPRSKAPAPKTPKTPVASKGDKTDEEQAPRLVSTVMSNLDRSIDSVARGVDADVDVPDLTDTPVLDPPVLDPPVLLKEETEVTERKPDDGSVIEITDSPVRPDDTAAPITINGVIDLSSDALSSQDIARMSAEELENGSFMGIYGPYGKPNNGKYTCPLCDQFESETDFAMTNHLAEELRYNRYKCNICEFGRPGMSEVRKHINETHTSSSQSEGQGLSCVSPNPQIETWVANVIFFQKKLMARMGDSPSVSLDNKKLSTVPKRKESVARKSVTRFSCSMCPMKGPSRLAVAKHHKAAHGHVNAGRYMKLLSKKTRPVSKSKTTARKSTTALPKQPATTTTIITTPPPPSEVEVSYYGNPPDITDEELKRLRITVPVNEQYVTMNVEQLGRMFNLFPQVTVMDFLPEPIV